MSSTPSTSAFTGPQGRLRDAAFVEYPDQGDGAAQPTVDVAIK